MLLCDEKNSPSDGLIGPLNWFDSSVIRLFWDVVETFFRLELKNLESVFIGEKFLFRSPSTELLNGLNDDLSMLFSMLPTDPASISRSIRSIIF